MHCGPCSPRVPESRAAAGPLGGRAVWKSAPSSSPKALLWQEGEQGASPLKAWSRRPAYRPLPAQVCIIGNAFLLIPSISTQILNEENGFPCLPSCHPQPGLAPQTGKARRLDFPRPLPPEQGPGGPFSVTNLPVRQALSLGLLPGA